MSGPKPSERAETGLLRAHRGRDPAEPARALVVQARESSPFTRKYRRITAQVKSRPSLHGGPGGDEQDAAVRLSDHPVAALGSGAPHRWAPPYGRDGPESAR